jgi:hypothetical protein
VSRENHYKKFSHPCKVTLLTSSNSKFEKLGRVGSGKRVKPLKHKIKKVLPAIKEKIQQFSVLDTASLLGI